jgi:cytohesin
VRKRVGNLTRFGRRNGGVDGPNSSQLECCWCRVGSELPWLLGEQHTMNLLTALLICVFSARSPSPSVNQDSRATSPTPAESRLLFESENGTARAVRAALDAGVDVNARNEQGETPLHRACIRNTSDVVTVLLEAGAIVDARDRTQATPLHNAAKRPIDEIAALLIKSGANVNARCSHGSSPLLLAAESGTFETVQLLLQVGARPDVSWRRGTPLHGASGNGRADGRAVKLLLDVRVPVDSVDDRGNSALHNATSAEIAAMLIGAGANVHLRNKGGATPLITTALSGGSSGALAVLIDAGADISAVDSTGISPLGAASRTTDGSSDSVGLLVRKGAQVNVSERDGSTPLHHACAAHHYENVQLLIAAGAKVQAKNVKGITPLHRAMWMRPEITDLSADDPRSTDVYRSIEALIKSGADVNAADSAGSTPLHFIDRCHDRALVEMILRHGAAVNSRDSLGRTPLHNAARSSTTAVVELLLQTGADPRASDTQGRTPYAIASEQNKEIIWKAMMSPR